MLKGLRTVIYHVEDLEAAKAWYRRILGIDPHFDEPFYVGFSVGGYELGLDPDTSAAAPGEGGAVVYWGVDDIDAARARLIGAGAAPTGEVQEVGRSVYVATVKDPFGNVLGLIENPHFRVEP